LEQNSEENGAKRADAPDMRLGEICIRDVVCANRNLTIQQAAQLMRTHHVGDLIIVDETTKGSMPLGVVTDRDLVVEVLAENIDGKTLTLGDILTSELVTASEDQDVFHAVEQMQKRGIRRLPIVDKGGCLLGILTLDDLLELLAMELAELSRCVARERRQEINART
jgi:CBS domain-containing protein